MSFNILPNENDFVKAIVRMARAAEVAANAYAESVRKQPDLSGENYIITINMDANMNTISDSHLNKVVNAVKHKR